MADINSSRTVKANAAEARAGEARPGEAGPERASPHGGGDELIDVVELLFFAYRDFTGEADDVLSELGFGRAHHRVLHFVNRRPGMRVADLLDILQITKQSLARVLKQLVDRGFIAQEAGAEDRRERRLHLTPQGHALARKLLCLQTARIGQALSAAGVRRGKAAAVAPGTVDTVRAFLVGMVAPGHRGEVQRLIAGAAVGSSGGSRAVATRDTAADHTEAGHTEESDTEEGMDLVGNPAADTMEAGHGEIE